MKKFIISVVFLLFIFCITTVHAEAPTTPLSQSDLIALSKPAIVKIYHQIDGKLSIPTIKLDVTTMTLSVDDTFTASPKTTYLAFPDYIISYKFDDPIDPETFYGTGFVINGDGYIVTNAHVASDKYSEREFLGKIETNLVDDMISAYDKKYPGKLDKLYPTQDEWDSIYTKLDADMLQLVTNSAKFDSKLVVIPQSSTDTSLNDLFKDGLDAKVVGMADDLFNEKNKDKDLAILKVEKTNLPALKIDNTNSTLAGQKIFVWGFPSNATFSDKDVTEPTFTEGIVSALKDSSDKSFKLLQTDAKVSSGSSGGPMLNEKGEVVGILTYTTDNTDGEGDSFAWGLPSDFILQVMNKSSVANVPSYYGNFLQGISLMNDKRCRNANVKFNQAKNTDENFSVSQYVQPYIDNCLAMINSGQSIDSFWDQAKVTLKEVGLQTWITIILAFLIAGGLIYEVLKLIRRTKKDETKMVQMEDLFHKDETEISKIEVEVDNQRKEIEGLKNQNKNTDEPKPTL